MAMSSRWTDSFLDAKRRIGDPPADRVVDDLFTAGNVDAVNALLRTLVRNDQVPPDELPPIVAEYLRDTVLLPPWADPELFCYL